MTTDTPRLWTPAPAQIPLILAGAGLWIWPVETQPPKHAHHKAIGLPNDKYTWTWWQGKHVIQSQYHQAVCPVCTGEVVGFREEWAVHEAIDRLTDEEITNQVHPLDVWYAGDSDGYPGRLRPPDTMPTWAVRTWRRVLSVGCEPIREICMLECHEAGIPVAKQVDVDFEVENVREAFLDFWNAAYPGKDWCWKCAVEVVDEIRKI